MLLVALMTLACRAPEADSVSAAAPEILVSVDDPCLAALGGPGSEGSGMAAWSRAHATWRFFGVSGDWLGADQALADSLEQSGFDAAAYAQGMDESCWVDAQGALGPATVELRDGVAWVQPGTGEVEVPAEALWVVLDFSALPAGSAGEEASLEALGQILSAEANLGALQERHFEGHPDNWQENVYSSWVSSSRHVVSGQGSARPLGVYLGPQAAPIAHRVAAALRLQERAVLLGHDAHSAIAESTWAPIDDQGMLIRRGLLTLDGTAFPDRVPADLPWAPSDIGVEDLEALVWQEVPAESTRAAVQEWDALAGYLPPDLTAGTLPAAFLVAHGILDRFWVYGEVTGTDLDATLDAALEEVSGISPQDRPAVEAALGHFMHALHDGHGFYGSFGVAAPEYSYLDLQLQLQGEQVLVRDSDEPGIDPGDEVLAIDGLDAQAWFAEVESRKSAATRGYRFDVASRELLRIEGSRTLTLQAPDGSVRDEVVTGGPAEEAADVPWGGSFRESGPLADLGAPELFYLNMNGDLGQTAEEIVAHLEGLEAEGLVVDMRDYPRVNHYQVATWLCQGTLYSPLFGVPTWSGSEQLEIVDSNYELPCEAGAFDGPIVWLVSNKSVSAAENFSQMVVPNPQVQVAGQQSAATNGNITLSFLPGGLFIYFTGMRILNPDGSLFHGVGIQPDLAVEVTPADFAAGRDPELEAAVGMFRE